MVTVGGQGEWATGPRGDRRRYRVTDPTPLPGGRGYVVEATRHSDGRRVALKLIEGLDPSHDPALLDATRVLTEHPHPHIAPPVDIFRGPGLFTGDDPPPDDESDLLCCVTEWVEGCTLRAVAPLDTPAVARLALDLAGALAHLHDTCGLAHLDIHPGNVVVAPDGGAHLIDLGTVVEAAARGSYVSGVVGFLPPERARGQADRRSDVWALGMIATHALLGHPVGKDDRPHVRREFERILPKGVDPEAVDRVLARCTADDPGERPTDVVAWAHELERALTPRKVAPILALVGLALVVGLVVAAVVLASRDRNGEEAVPAEPAEAANEVDALAGGEGDDSGPGDGGDPGAHTSMLVVPDDATATTEPACYVLAEPAPWATPAEIDTVLALADRLRAATSATCALEPPEVFRSAIHQLVDEDGTPVVVFASDDGVVHLTPAELQSYKEIAGRSRPENAIDLGGYPVRTEPGDGLGTRIWLSGGGVVLGERDDTQSFWLPQPVLEVWERETGGLGGTLGLPMTNPYLVDDGLRQDFAGGYLFLPVDMPSTWPELTAEGLEVHLADPAAASVVPTGRTGIIRQPTGTAWWIDVAGRRRWIQDGETWSCLGGYASLLANDVSGVDVARLPVGPPATCDLYDW